MNRIVDQPNPKNVNEALPSIIDLVHDDLRQRDEVGQERYGCRLKPFNGRDALVDAYNVKVQEALDLAIYLRQIIYEIENE